MLDWEFVLHVKKYSFLVQGVWYKPQKSIKFNIVKFQINEL
jgi:hypothetical protein